MALTAFSLLKVSRIFSEGVLHGVPSSLIPRNGSNKPTRRYF